MIWTGTTVFIELHRNSSGAYEVALKQYYPQCGSANGTCPLEPIHLEGCAKSDLCSLSEFTDVIETIIARTGDYIHLCRHD